MSKKKQEEKGFHSHLLVRVEGVSPFPFDPLPLLLLPSLHVAPPPASLPPPLPLTPELPSLFFFLNKMHTPLLPSTSLKNKSAPPPSLPPSCLPSLPPHAEALEGGLKKFSLPISIVPGREEEAGREAGKEEGVLLMPCPCLVKCLRSSSRKEAELCIMLQPKRIRGPP